MRPEDKSSPPNYRNRDIIPVRSGVLNGWDLKHYEISASPEPIAAAIRAEADQAVDAILGSISPNQLGCGFTILHKGEEAIWLLIDLWEDDILSHRVLRSDLAERAEFRVLDTPYSVTCVWELLVVEHERRAWVQHVLQNRSNPNKTAYLSDWLTINTN